MNTLAPGKHGQSAKRTTYLQIVLRLRMFGTVLHSTICLNCVALN